MVFPEKIYPSKRDAWLVNVLIFAGLLSFSLTFMAFLDAPGPGSAGLVIFFLATAFVVWTFTRTFYVLTATELLIRSGPFRWSIPFTDLREVRPTRNPLSSPALSLDRLEIRHAYGAIMISPEDKRGFLEDLAGRTPGLTLDGDGAVRPPVPSAPGGRGAARGG
jgi:hypothetical protein